MQNTRRFQSALVIATIATIAWTHFSGAWRVQPASTLSVSGTSTTRSYECRAKTFDGTVESATADAVVSGKAGEKSVAATELIVPIAQLDCGNGTMNEHMRKALKSKENPNIEFKVASYALTRSDSGTRVRMDGTLTIGGAAKTVTIDAAAKPSPDGALIVTGAYTLNMTDFGLKPPTLMLGTMKVANKVTVKFELLLKP